MPSRRPGADASRLRSAAAVRLERGAVIVSIAVTRARRLIAPRPTSVIVAIAATWGWLTRATLPGHRDPPISPLRKEGKGLYPRFARGESLFHASVRGGPARPWRNTTGTSASRRQERSRPTLQHARARLASFLFSTSSNLRPDPTGPTCLGRGAPRTGGKSRRCRRADSSEGAGPASPGASNRPGRRYGQLPVAVRHQCRRGGNHVAKGGDKGLDGLDRTPQVEGVGSLERMLERRTKVAATSPTYCRSCKPP